MKNLKRQRKQTSASLYLQLNGLKRQIAQKNRKCSIIVEEVMGG